MCLDNVDILRINQSDNIYDLFIEMPHSAVFQTNHLKPFFFQLVRNISSSTQAAEAEIKPVPVNIPGKSQKKIFRSTSKRQLLDDMEDIYHTNLILS